MAPYSSSSSSLLESSETEKLHHDPIHVEEVLIKGGAMRAFLSSLQDANSLFGGSALSLGERIKSGESLLQISNLVTQDEVEYLKRVSLETADSQKSNPDCSRLDEGLKGRVYIRMPTMAAAKRENGKAADALPEETSDLLEDIIERALIFIDQEMCPSIKKTLFGQIPGEDGATSSTKDDQDVSIAELFRTGQLEFSSNEPAINVYSAPSGHFGLHKDEKAMTILMPLSDPVHDFTGGGTAFWSQSYPREGQHDPSLILAPEPGTALVFGGFVSHKGLHIKTGTRAVFVASFSRVSTKKEV